MRARAPEALRGVCVWQSNANTLYVCTYVFAPRPRNVHFGRDRAHINTVTHAYCAQAVMRRPILNARTAARCSIARARAALCVYISPFTSAAD